MISYDLFIYILYNIQYDTQQGRTWLAIREAVKPGSLGFKSLPPREGPEVMDIHGLRQGLSCGHGERGKRGSDVEAQIGLDLAADRRLRQKSPSERAHVSSTARI